MQPDLHIPSKGKRQGGCFLSKGVQDIGCVICFVTMKWLKPSPKATALNPASRVAGLFHYLFTK